MPIAKELTVILEDRPGTLGKLCQALADHKVNIVALQSISCEGKGMVRLVVDQPTLAHAALDLEQLSYREEEVAQAKFLHRPGQLARAASRLGDAHIDIEYAYSGADPITNTPVVIFGVVPVATAASILDQVAATPR